MPDKHADHQHTKLQEVLEKKSYDLGLLGAMVHLFGDALNNLFVIIAAAVIWKTGFSRVDGIASFLVGISILATSIPLMWRSARLLLEAAPEEMSLAGIEEDIAALPGVKAVHEIHIFSLSSYRLPFRLRSVDSLTLLAHSPNQAYRLAPRLRQLVLPPRLHARRPLDPRVPACMGHPRRRLDPARTRRRRRAVDCRAWDSTGDGDGNQTEVSDPMCEG